MLIDTTYRSNAEEIMDDFALEGEILRDALDKIASINQLLGGNKVTIQGVKELTFNTKKKQTISVLDVGCGNGDMLRIIADYGMHNNINFKLTGIDANQYTVNYAQKLSEAYANINYLCEDIFDDKVKEQQYDIILCTLTLHHFKDNEILTLISSFSKRATMGIIINDLHRNKMAYYLFKALCFVFGLNTMSREDGLVSILRGFKKQDILNYANQLHIKNFTIRWKWAFRYQWIIRST
ncbi:methyltransferase domain-containing protein [Pedobacter polaris]|uniref:Methyltransferase domain-containing protein n=1 Tax=Pedobacter polaris TaxID=2571273 RepID=A0A4V6WN44_9SPHI|nr:methyltransferase domain-containing protein [Pedobacter polaris]TKC06716.1 methyltransferase domain-containing protein [Pedobacter polaris]